MLKRFLNYLPYASSTGPSIGSSIKDSTRPLLFGTSSLWREEAQITMPVTRAYAWSFGGRWSPTAAVYANAYGNVTGGYMAGPHNTDHEDALPRSLIFQPNGVSTTRIELWNMLKRGVNAFILRPLILLLTKAAYIFEVLHPLSAQTL